MSLFDLLAHAASLHGKSAALFSGSRQVATFDELHSRALRLGAGIGKHVSPGERILIATANCCEVVEVLFAAWSQGCVVVPVNAKLHPREIAAIAQDCKPRLAFVSLKFGEAVQLPDCRTVVIGLDDYRALFESAVSEPVKCGSDALAWLFYTSGTTGNPKGAMLTHGNLLAMAETHWTDIDDPQAGSSLLHAAPMSHGSGLYVIPYLARGVRQVVPASGQFDPAEVLELCEVHPGTAMFLAPTMIQRLREHAEASAADTSSIRLIVYGGGPMYVSEIKAAMELMGPKFAQIYGQGESPMTITGMAASDHVGASDTVLGSVGRARTGLEVRVADQGGAALPAGQAGEIICRGGTVMAGYWNMHEATEAALRDGWLWTGDVGVFDDGGFLTLKDRTKDLIISGGSNIYPREVEEVLLSHPSVSEASVVGVAHPEWGEIVVAHVAPKAGQAIDEAELDAHCLAHIARFKRPKRYIHHESLPKNAYGKVLKRQLREA